MTNIEVCKDVLENGYAYVRPTPNVPYSYDLKRTGKKKGWYLFDATTAGAIVAVHNALSPENQAKMPRIGMVRLAEFAFKHVKLG